MPTMGSHSTMDRPEWVRRVSPPSSTITATMKQQASNQIATSR